MATIGSLAISLIARTTEFSRGINAAKNKITEFKAAAAAAKTGGFSVGTIDVEKFERLEARMQRGKTVARAFQLALGGGVAEAVVAASRRVEQFGQSVSNMAGQLLRGEMTLKEFAADALRSIPVLGDMTKAFDAITSAAWDSAAAIAKTFGASAKTVDALTSSRTKLAEAEELARAADERNAAALEASNKAAAEAKRIADEQQRIDDDRLRSIKQIIDAATQEAQAIGRTDAEVGRGRLIKLAASAADLEAYDAAMTLTQAYREQEERISAATAKAQQASQAMHDAIVRDAEGIYSETRTPMEKYRAEIEKIQGLVLAGVIDDETADRAAKAAINQMKSARDSLNRELNRSIGSASVVNLSRTYVPSLSQGGKDPQLVQTNALLRKIADNTKGGKVAVAA